jgi:hypothetical protein
LVEKVEHEGKALAADETDAHHRRTGIASVHVRAVITWVVIFPLVAAGMNVLAVLAPDWHPLLRTLARIFHRMAVGAPDPVFAVPAG